MIEGLGFWLLMARAGDLEAKIAETSPTSSPEVQAWWLTSVELTWKRGRPEVQSFVQISSSRVVQNTAQSQSMKPWDRHTVYGTGVYWYLAKPSNQLAHRLRQLNTYSACKCRMWLSTGTGSEVLSTGPELDLLSSAFHYENPREGVKSKIVCFLLLFPPHQAELCCCWQPGSNGKLFFGPHTVYVSHLFLVTLQQQLSLTQVPQFQENYFCM